MRIGQALFCVGRILVGYFVAVGVSVFVAKLIFFADNGFNFEGYYAQSSFNYRDFVWAPLHWLVLVFVVPFVALTEFFSVRRWLPYVAYSAGLGFLVTLIFGQLARSFDPLGFMTIVAITAAGGFVFWIIAGRFAGGLFRALLGADEDYGR